MAKRLKELGQKACAITDYGNMYGAVSFFNAMASNGIKPIIGYEAFLKFGSRFDRSTAVEAGEKGYYNLILLARDLEGYQNLVHLASKAFTEGFYYKPRIDIELLSEKSAGLIGLSGGHRRRRRPFSGNGNEEKALANAKTLEDILGAGNFFLEIQDQAGDQGKKLIKDTADLSKSSGIPLVATNDVHYLNKDDARAHQVLISIGEGRTVSENSRDTSAGRSVICVRLRKCGRFLAPSCPNRLQTR